MTIDLRSFDSQCPSKEEPMATIHLHRTTSLTPEQYVAGLTDFGPGRSKVFGNSADAYLKVHQRGRTEADVTEGSSGIWERLHYDWSDPNHVVLTLGLVLSTIGGNVLKKAFENSVIAMEEREGIKPSAPGTQVA